jgi:hypothetical protein
MVRRRHSWRRLSGDDANRAVAGPVGGRDLELDPTSSALIIDVSSSGAGG